MSAGESVVATIQRYQKNIQKYHGNSSKVQHYINKLYSLPVTVQHLQDTGVGKTVNSLRKSDGEVGDAARALVAKWKQMVEEESENEQDGRPNPNEVHKSHNKSSGLEQLKHSRDKSERREKTVPEDSSKNSSSRDQSRGDHSKSQKRKKELSFDQYKEKRRKYEDSDIYDDHLPSSESHLRSQTNGNNDDPCLDEDWRIDDFNNSRVLAEEGSKNYRNASEEHNALSSEDEANKGEYLSHRADRESSQRKTEEDVRHNYDKSSRKDKHSSHKHKNKSSSSSSEKSNKLPSSHRSEEKESKSSSGSRHSKEKSSLAGSSTSSKKSSNQEDKLKIKGKDKSDKSDKQKDKHQNKDDKKSKEKRKDKEKKKAETDDELDSFSGKSFGEALGMMFAPDKARKKSSQASSSLSSPSSSKSSKSSSISTEKKAHSRNIFNSSSELERECASMPLEPSLEVDEDLGLPTLNPNYKPLPQPNFYNSPPKRFQCDDDDLTNIMYSKVQRTKVFSGNKTGYTSVPSLFDLCTRVLQENIDALEYTGGVPFDLLKPVLQRASAEQLFNLEHYNAYLIEDTDPLWEFHCKKFRGKKREEMETWREMYLRCSEELERKFKSVTATISATHKAKAAPVRKTQLAYIEGTVKPPRNIARKQAKFGTASTSSSSQSQRPETSGSSGSSGLSTSFTGRSALGLPSAPAVSVPTPRGAGGSQSSSCKPKAKAPLMQKALQLIKYNRFKR